MPVQSSIGLRKWGWRALIALFFIGIGFAIAENFFPSLRSGAPTTFCTKLQPGLSFGDIQTMASSNGYKVPEGANSFQVKLNGGCVCFIDLIDGKMSKSSALCID